MNISEEIKFNTEISNKYIKNGSWDIHDEFQCVCDVIGATAKLGHSSIMIENKNVSSEAIDMLRQEGFYVKEEGPFIYIGWQ